MSRFKRISGSERRIKFEEKKDKTETKPYIKPTLHKNGSGEYQYLKTMLGFSLGAGKRDGKYKAKLRNIKEVKTVDPKKNWMLILDKDQNLKKMSLNTFLFEKDVFKEQPEEEEVKSMDLAESSETEEEPLTFSQKRRK